MSFDFNSISSLSQLSLQSSTNSRAFDFDGLEESLVDNELNSESNESLYDLNDSPLNDDTTQRRQSTTTTVGRQSSSREQSFHRIRDALIRDSNNRTEEDLDLIHNFLSLIVRQRSDGQKNSHSLVNKDFQTRRLLAKHMVLAEIESRDTRVLTNGERLDAYCVVACGSLRHVTNDSAVHSTTGDDSCVDCVDGECRLSCVSEPRVRYLTVGDEFGASLDDRVVFGEIFTAEDFVWVLCVPHVVFDEICGEKSFKTVFDEKNEKIIEIRNQFTNELIRATKDRLLELLFRTTDDSCREDTLDDSQELEFISDFLLTFRLFWSQKQQKRVKSIEELMERVLEEMLSPGRADKCLKIVLFWISNHFQDFDSKLLQKFESILNQKLHKKLFYFTLSSKSRDRHVTVTRSDRQAVLPFSLIGGYECGTRLFVSDVTDDQSDLCRGDRLLQINGVDCHVMEVSRALQLCRQSTHLSLHVKFDPNLFHQLLDGQISRSDKRNNQTTDVCLKTTATSFASLKPIQQLSSGQQTMSSSSVSSQMSSNNNWKQKVRQIVQNVNKNIHNIQNNNSSTTGPQMTTLSTTGGLTTGDAPPEIIKIYYESEYRFLPIHATTSARECIQLALIEFQLTSYSSRDFALFEYKLIDATTATSAVKRLSDNFQNLVQNLSLDSRIYLKCVSGQTPTSGAPTDAEITRDIQRESSVNSLLTLESESLARELTERDLELFCRIESQQFVYDLTSDDSPSVTTPTTGTTPAVDDNFRVKELKEFEEQTNRELFWTTNRILFEANSPQKRVKVAKQLIKVALVLCRLNNYNTLFAILSGLSHQSISRLKGLFERIPQKSLNKLKKLYKLMDPSKNFLHFRQQLRDSKPPVIPFFPLVKKDFQFIDLANQTFLSCDDSKQQLINWEKMRLLGIKCRELQQMTAPSGGNGQQPTTPTNREMTLSSSVAKEAFNQLKALNDSKENNYKKIWEKQRMRKRVQHYLEKTFSEIICDENQLFEKSLECEPQPQQQVPSANDRLSSVRSSQLSTSSSMSSTPSSTTGTTPQTTHHSVMPSPTPSSHSSSPSLSSSTTNSSDIPSSHRIRFGIKDDTGLRKLLALSDNCVSVSHSTTHSSLQRPQSHSSVQKSYQNFHNLSLVSPTTASVVPTVVTHQSFGANIVYKPLLPEESSSVTSLRRLEQIQQMSRFREQFLPVYNDLSRDLSPFQSSRTSRPLLPSYDQTIQRMKKKFNKNEENVV